VYYLLIKLLNRAFKKLFKNTNAKQARLAALYTISTGKNKASSKYFAILNGKFAPFIKT
jgi:hypothetical protein